MPKKANKDINDACSSKQAKARDTKSKKKEEMKVRSSPRLKAQKKMKRKSVTFQKCEQCNQDLTTFDAVGFVSKSEYLFP